MLARRLLPSLLSDHPRDTLLRFRVAERVVKIAGPIEAGLDHSVLPWRPGDSAAKSKDQAPKGAIEIGHQTAPLLSGPV
jgi:hypothetical protein